jgi:hypothetical protein
MQYFFALVLIIQIHSLTDFSRTPCSKTADRRLERVIPYKVWARGGNPISR